MREEMANLVYPVLAEGLRLKERLQNREPLPLDREQARLKNLLLTQSQSRRVPDFGGYRGADEYAPQAGMEGFQGARYALSCWLDEMFLLNEPWNKWEEADCLEWQLYRTNERAEMFWQQAELAEACQGPDALEVYYLCVMLGFRGKYRGQPEELRDRCSAMEARLAESQQEWPAPQERKPSSDAPPLRGRAQAQTMMRVACAVIGLLILLGAAFLASPWSH